MIKWKRKLLTAVTAAAILVCMLTGVAFADGTEKTALIPTSDKDYADWGEAGIANTYTSIFVGGCQGGMKGFFMRGTDEQAVGQFETFLRSRNVYLSDSLRSGQWTNHPAIFVSLFPEAQRSDLQGPSSRDANEGMNTKFRAGFKSVMELMGKTSWLGSNVVSAELTANVVLYKLVAGNWVETQNVTVSLGKKDEPNKMIFNGVLFYDLNNDAQYKVSVWVGIDKYWNEGATHPGGPVVFVRPENAYKTFSFKEQIYGDNALVEFRACYVGKWSDGLYTLLDDSYANKVSHVVPPSVIGVYTAWSGGIASANPMLIINDPDGITTKPIQTGDARRISTVFKMLRLLAVTICIFGMMGAIVRVADPTVSGFALYRIREALSGWVLLLFIIGASTMILSLLVQALFF